MKNKICLVTFCLVVTSVANAQSSSLGSWTDPNPGSNMFKNFNVYTHNTVLDGSYVNFNQIENTKGKRYLFDGWAKGKVVTTNGEVIASDSIFFNIDKMRNDLLVTSDKKNIIAVTRADIKSFALGDGKDSFEFERIDVINPQGFLQVLVKNDHGYTLYKSITTKFKKADYHTDGLMESGTPYDQYSDNYKYYVVLPDGKGFKDVSLKSKSIKELFKAEPKAAEYMSSHKGDPVDEAYLSGLIKYMNQ